MTLDGYPRALSNISMVLIGRKLAPIVGRVCMDHCMVDITDIGWDVDVGEEVVLFGGEENKEITVSKISEKLGTINYELVCGIGKRVARIYCKHGKIESISNYILH